MTSHITVRYFAAARAAAGIETETLEVETGGTIDDLVRTLTRRNDRLAAVLRGCSFLKDGVAVRDQLAVLQGKETIDVLPPFAGG